jgi:hypothetical protein
MVGELELEVKVTIDDSVPLINNLPSTSNCVPESKLTVTPGFMVNVAPEVTRKPKLLCAGTSEFWFQVFEPKRSTSSGLGLPRGTRNG